MDNKEAIKNLERIKFVCHFELNQEEKEAIDYVIEALGKPVDV